MKKDRLYTVNKMNRPLFAKGVDRIHNNIFDGEDGSEMQFGVSRSSLPGIADVTQRNYQFPSLDGIDLTSLNVPQSYNVGKTRYRGSFKSIAAADKSANPWDYADDLSTTAQFLKTPRGQSYANSKNAFGISKANNPFSKMNLSGTLTAAAPALGAAAGKLIGGGYSTGIGNAMSTIGGMAAAIPGPYGAAISAGLQVAGGVVNGLFGEKVDQEKLNAAKAGTSYYNNYTSNAGYYDDIVGPQAQSAVMDAYKGGLLSKKKARKKNQAMRDARLAAMEHAFGQVKNNVANINMDQINNILAQSYAFGGPLDALNTDMGMGAVNYGFMSDYLTNKKMQTEAKNKIDGISQMTVNNTFAKGGKINIKHPGRLTELKKRTGKTEAQLWAEGKPEVRKMITFARNARKWKKAYGGYMDASKNLFALGGPDDPPQPNKFKGFALLAPYPDKKGRTPEWDDDEAIFNEKDDTEYLNSKSLPFTRTPSGYYLDEKGKYYPGTIYAQNPEGAMTHYDVSPNGISYRISTPNGSASMGSYDMKNLSLDEYNNLKGLGLDVNRFYENDDEAARYIPNPDIKFNNSYSVGNSQITYDPILLDLAPNKANQELYDQMLHGAGQGRYHVVDPDKGYDFSIKTGMLRDGGSETLGFSGKYPEGLEDGMIYAIPWNSSDSEIEEANKRRDAINNILSGYGLTFGNHHALGGDLQSHGSDWSNGVTHIDEGGTHEENPYEGVQLGVDPEGIPNLVEEGETVYNDYVFSKRIMADADTLKRFHLPKKSKLSFADISKKLEKESVERPNDPYSQASLKVLLGSLSDEQERQRQEMQAAKAQEAFASMSPEEQMGLVQYAQQQQQQEQMAQEQAMQEQAMAAQGMPEQYGDMQMSPEEAMMTQQMGGPQEMSAPNMSAYGGNLFGTGGNLFATGSQMNIGGDDGDFYATLKKNASSYSAADAKNKSVAARQAEYNRKQQEAAKARKAREERERKAIEDAKIQARLYEAGKIKGKLKAREEDTRYNQAYPTVLEYLQKNYPDIEDKISVARTIAEEYAKSSGNIKIVGNNSVTNELFNKGRNGYRKLISMGIKKSDAFKLSGGNVSDPNKALKNWEDYNTTWGKSSSGLKTRTEASGKTYYLAANNKYYSSEKAALDVNRKLNKGPQKAASKASNSSSASSQNLFERLHNNRIGLTGGTPQQAASEPQVQTQAQTAPEYPAFMPMDGSGYYPGYSPTGYSTQSYQTQGYPQQNYGYPQQGAVQTPAQSTPAAVPTEPVVVQKPKSVKEQIYNSLNFLTDEQFRDWADTVGVGPIDDWDNIRDNTAFMDAYGDAVGLDSELYHAMQEGYDFGAYKPDKTTGVTFPSITRGNWENQLYEGWKDSQDPGWLEAVENWKKQLGDNWADTVKGYNREQIADALRKTQAFQRGTKWLQDSEDNRLRYLTELYTNQDTPEKAKRYAEKFVTTDADGNIVWKDGAARDYNTIFNNPSGRAANPGTYWHTPLEAVREQQVKNYIRRNGNWELAAVDVPEGYNKSASYSWSGKDDNIDYTNNYYLGPDEFEELAVDEDGNVHPVERDKDGNIIDNGAGGDNRKIVPKLRDERLRYAGLFGPAVGLGMQALGIGKPDTSGMDAALERANRVAFAHPYLIGDYMKYKPFDRLFYANQLQANTRATDRNLMNTSGGNQGAARAAMLANGYQGILGLGNLYRQGDEYNLAQYQKMKEFNRGTNMFNAEALNKNSQFNADAINRNTQFTASLAADAARQKMVADAGWNNAIYGNVAGLFKGLGDLGRENAEHNAVASIMASGIVPIKPERFIANDYLTYDDLLTDKERKKLGLTRSAAHGGKLKKGKKRGLTF